MLIARLNLLSFHSITRFLHSDVSGRPIGRASSDEAGLELAEVELGLLNQLRVH